LHSRSRAAIASPRAAWATATAGVVHEARASVVSPMSVLVKPIPAVSANTKVMTHTAQPTSAVGPMSRVPEPGRTGSR
jgi:hypothetical protein